MRYLQRRIKRSKPQRYDEIRVTNLFGRLRRDSDFVANSLLLHGMGGRNQEDFGRSVADGIFQYPFPVIATLEAKDVGKNNIAESSQFRTEPQRESVVLRTGMTHGTAPGAPLRPWFGFLIRGEL